MFRYADPAACPVCRTTMAAGSHTCPDCGAQLSGPVAQSLFRTLTDADGLVAQLAALPAPAQGSLLPPDQVRFPAAGAHDVRRSEWPAPRRHGLSAASVPKILLGLGALCLLVAAIVFLAVAWALLGVGGRTAVLILLTAGAVALGGLLAKRNLRAGAEAFVTVSLGLLTLDLLGAESSGWLGFLDRAGFQTVLGACLAVAGIGGATFLRRFPAGLLVSPQVIGALGLGLGTAGLVQSVFQLGPHNHHLDALSTVLWMALLGAGLVGTRLLRLPIASILLTIGVGLAWVTLVVMGLVRIQTPLTFASAWADFAPWPTVLAAIMAGALARFARSLPLPARVVSAAAAVALLALLSTLPALDESPNTLVLVASALVASASVATHLLARPWRPVVAAPAGVAAGGLLLAALAFVNGTLPALLFSPGWSQGVDSTLPRAELTGLWPALLPLVVAMLLLALWGAINLGRDVPITHVALPMVMLVVASALAVPTAYGVGLGVMVGLLLVAAAVFAGAGLPSAGLRRQTALALASLLAAGAVLVSLQSQVLTAVTTGLVTLGALAVSSTGHRAARLVGDVVLAPAAGAFLWTTLDLIGVETPWRALPMLVVAGAWAILGARPERELPVALTMVATVVLCVTGIGHGSNGQDWSGQAWSSQTWLAVDLTLSGVLVHLSALVNAHRRWLGWAGLGLMVLAQWVRLEQLGVETVEAYTLPLAVVLLAVGVLRMRDTALRSARALGPGLTLALVPSFFIALADPVSWRALALGVACLVVAVGGASLRWSAPLVAGALIGAPLALREVTHAVTLPQWLVIGLIGVVLTVVGVTWERSLNEVRQAAGFLRRLR
ncbi:hypothetical protein ncot_01705 [Nocardioides sp. JQ2195]|uniref:SCO7613 C-terminal domain-containing membrane protein n=1 Tax=Nocardioides sp. JQ2195 TaxID=2592334 RepID=UPI00143EA809|nr:hypothetical protein [Nocardioides sp. JQ2195]QIX25445.1 hypothetical protein ncot_01705 [Nocardioides sp. JQ2195]